MRSSFTSIAALTAASGMATAVFAAAGAEAGKSGKSAGAPPPPPSGDAPAAVAADGKPRNVAAIRTDLPPPAPKKTGPRAGQSLYDFGALEINGSFGILDATKSAKKFASTVTAANHRYDVEAKNPDGTVIMVPGAEIKDAAGVVTGRQPSKPKMVPSRKFICADVDPKTDPDKATVRVWRVALPTA